jgi:hypothetical protein
LAISATVITLILESYSQAVNRSTESARGRWAFGLTVTGFCWALALVPASFLVPVYGGSAAGDAGLVTHQSATLVGENGPWVLSIVALPAVLASIVWFGLHRRCTRSSVRGSALAWAGIVGLFLLSVVAAASVGPILLPAGLLLAAAASLTPSD